MNVFNPKILNSFDQLSTTFSGEAQIKSICTSRSALEKRLDRRGEIAWLTLTAPFEKFFSIFLRALSYLFHFVGAKHLATRCEIVSKHLESNCATLLNMQTFRERFLSPCINTYQPWISDVYLQEDILISSISDPQVRALTFCEIHQNIQFYRPYGLCRGISFWFIYLYLKTAPFFANPEEHLLAVSKLFQNGAPREAALLHCFFDIPSLLGLQITKHYDTQDARESSLSQITSLPQGIFSVGLSNHLFCFIKIHEHLGYIFDPNGGLLRLEGENVSIQLLHHIYSYKMNFNLNENPFIYYFDEIALPDEESTANTF